MISVVGVADLATGWSPSLELADDTTPGRPLVAVELDSAARASPQDIDAAASVVGGSLALFVGLATAVPPPATRALLDALDLTLVTRGGECDRREVVPVDDLDAALAKLGAVTSAVPRSAVTLGQVLRQTEHLDVRGGLAAEAAAYSVLLAGREFKDWLRRRGEPRPARSSTGPVVAVERHADVLSVVLDCPDRRNAFNASLRDELVDALAVAIMSTDLRVELSGRGTNFSSGGDLDEFGTATEVDGAYLIRLERHPGWLLHQLGERAIVRVHGACIGAGIEMPSLAHRIIAADDAYFALPEVSMGVIPGAGGTVGIPRRIGRWRTAWLALTGDRIDAATALEWGLVDDVVRG